MNIYIMNSIWILAPFSIWLTIDLEPYIIQVCRKLALCSKVDFANKSTFKFYDFFAPFTSAFQPVFCSLGSFNLQAVCLVIFHCKCTYTQCSLVNLQMVNWSMSLCFLCFYCISVKWQKHSRTSRISKNKERLKNQGNPGARILLIGPVEVDDRKLIKSEK